MQMHEVMEVNAKSRQAARSKKELSHLRVSAAENGGHIVEHHFEHNGEYHEPEQHVFGEGEHEKMLAHVANALKLPEPGAEEEEQDGKGKHGAAEHEDEDEGEGHTPAID